jgi:glycosyltransferase involved in cell wall biosynthesis
MRSAAAVICDSYATRDDLLRYRLIAAENIVVIPIGVDRGFNCEEDPEADSGASVLLGPKGLGPEILHVGSTIKRKRIDTLLEVFGRIRNHSTEARLIRVGGAFTPEQENLVDRLSLRRSIVTLPFISKRILAAVYRRADLLLMPSASEGFGLPVVEAMACGTPVVSSDIPALREVGGDASAYCGVSEVNEWVATAIDTLQQEQLHPDEQARRRAQGVSQASRYSWAENARQVSKVYTALARAIDPSSSTRAAAFEDGSHDR